MKRLMTLLLIVSLGAFAVGCGADKDKDKDKDGEKDKSQTPATGLDVKKGEKTDPSDLGSFGPKDDNGSSTTSNMKDKGADPDDKTPMPEIDGGPDLTIPEFNIDNPFKEEKDKENDE